jgi:hypothetical protein
MRNVVIRSPDSPTMLPPASSDKISEAEVIEEHNKEKPLVKVVMDS